MNTILKNGTILGALTAVLLGTTGCAEFYKKAYDWSDAKGTEFTKALANGYYQFGKNEEYVMIDELDAAHFLRKAGKAQDGCAVVPEKPCEWNVPDNKLPELKTARARLISALKAGGTTVAPQLAAKAQVSYDCWVEQQEENWQWNDIKACRGTFYNSLAALEKMLGGILQAPPAHAIQFNTGSAELDGKAQEILDEVVIFASSTELGRRIHLIGRTDAAGPEGKNKKLSKKRAEAVKKSLVARGVPANLITTEAAGEMPGKQHDEDHRRVDVLYLQYN